MIKKFPAQKDEKAEYKEKLQFSNNSKTIQQRDSNPQPLSS